MGKVLKMVPAVTIFFWIIKVLATTVGETVLLQKLFKNVRIDLT